MRKIINTVLPTSRRSSGSNFERRAFALLAAVKDAVAVDRFATFVIDHKKPIVWLTLALAVIGTVMTFLVPINYNLSEYLPETTESMLSLIHISSAPCSGRSRSSAI